MYKTLNEIKELAIATENSYLMHKISILETEIKIAICDEKIETYNKIYNNE